MAVLGRMQGRHPELVSGSKMMQIQEIPKQVRDDRDGRILG